MASLWNDNISIQIFGESHGKSIGVVIDNLPSGEYIDPEKIYEFMSRRRAKNNGTTTPRIEADIPQIQSGLFNDRTTGTPLCAIIENSNTHSKDYSDISHLARPGHADYTGAIRYGGFNDYRGGGHFSGRLTAPLCFAGAVAAQILERRGIYTGAHILSIHNVKDKKFDKTKVSKEQILEIRKKDFPVIDDECGEKMRSDILAARKGLESLGGVIECACVNVPAGIGSPIFGGIENSISSLVFGIPAVKGIEFGAGFSAALMTGSQDNDEFYIDDNGNIKTYSNNHGGILGGISSGMPITLNVAFKPTSSIAKPQRTIDFKSMTNETIVVKGRHDPCIVPRAVPCVESAVNIAVLNHLLEYPHFH